MNWIPLFPFLLAVIIISKTTINASSSSNYLYNLDKDPYESTNVIDKSSYSSIVTKISKLHDSFASSVVKPTEISQSTREAGWAKCGGVCSFLDKGDNEKENIPNTEETTTRRRQLRHDHSSSSSSSSSPNIVFVLVDDWGYNDVGYRSSYLSWTTPTIDQLASEGIKLENYYTSYYCMPARSSLMTGRYAFRTGMWDSNYESELPLEETTLAEELQSLGYKTYMVGKWHLGYSTTAHKPLSRGFDAYYGFLMGKVDYWTKMYNNHYLDLQDGDELVTSSTEISSNYHNAYLFQSKAETFIQTHATKYGTSTPLFLYYSMQLIHSPVSAPDIYVSRCHASTVDDDYKADTERNYCGLNVMLDEAIANLTCTLNNYGYNDNTYLIIASDNGGDPSTGVGSSHPFKGYKNVAWNGGVAATAIIHSQLLSSKVKGSSYNGLMHVTDWFPTLLSIASNGKWSSSQNGNGNEHNKVIKSSSGYDLDGVDMYKALIKNKDSDREIIVHYHDGDSSVIQYGNYKLFTSYQDSEIYSPPYIFKEDENPNDASYSCSDPTFYSTRYGTMVRYLTNLWGKWFG